MEFFIICSALFVSCLYIGILAKLAMYFNTVKNEYVVFTGQSFVLVMCLAPIIYFLSR